MTANIVFVPVCECGARMIRTLLPVAFGFLRLDALKSTQGPKAPPLAVYGVGDALSQGMHEWRGMKREGHRGWQSSAAPNPAALFARIALAKYPKLRRGG